MSHSADAAMVAWGRLGVPEVWRFQPKASQFAICVRRDDGSYSDTDRSLAFPALSSADVLEQLNRANELGADRWNRASSKDGFVMSSVRDSTGGV